MENVTIESNKFDTNTLKYEQKVTDLVGISFISTFLLLLIMCLINPISFGFLEHLLR
jgi:hypothetical protein